MHDRRDEVPYVVVEKRGSGLGAFLGGAIAGALDANMICANTAISYCSLLQYTGRGRAARAEAAGVWEAANWPLHTRGRRSIEGEARSGGDEV